MTDTGHQSSLIRLYDSYSRSVVPIARAINGKSLGIYCCGPTVYAPAHIGNFRTFILQDVLRRTLETSGMRLRHVRNITDVDDKTIRKSQAAGEPLQKFTHKWTEHFHKDCRRLNILQPHEEPRAASHIEDQIDLIAKLLTKGHAYKTSDGSVYFRVRSWPQYGNLSHLDRRKLRTQAENSAGERNTADDYEREAIADFALWKAWKPEDGGNYWPSPWGKGRPGWHSECAAMALRYLGETFDVHAGGIDLCFPHHDNEIALAECTTGRRPFARHWFHTAHLLVDGRKMSKSLGNLYTITDLQLKGYSTPAIRYTLLSGHYRQPLNFTLNALDASESALKKLRRLTETLLQRAYGAKWRRETFTELGNTAVQQCRWGYFEKAWRALTNDLNTPDCLGSLFEALHTLERLEGCDAKEIMRALAGLLYALGIDLFKSSGQSPSPRVIPQEVKQLAERRWKAKCAKDWATADKLREELIAKNWSVKDSKHGYTVSPTHPSLK